VSPHCRNPHPAPLRGACSRRSLALRTIVAAAIAACAVALPAPAGAQDASSTDADLYAAATVGHDPDGGAAAPAPSGSCQSDPLPAGHEFRVETRITPPQPVIGDRVVITYRLFHRSGDAVEFDPDPVAYSQSDIELEYARQQPDRDRRAHAGPGGSVYGEVQVSVQPFRTGEVSIPAQLARLNAAGDIVRVCTTVVRFRVRDPFVNDPHPVPRDVTPPELVHEDALRWRWIALGLDALFAVIVLTLVANAYARSRPKKIIPPPPPRAPWLIALESLDALERGDLLSRGLLKDYYDAVSDVVRRYVGGYRGFDALEMTTDELLARLRIAPLPVVTSAEIEHLLRECDLVKFARYVPSHEESATMLPLAYEIVRRSMPARLDAGGRPRDGESGRADTKSTVEPGSGRA